MTGQFSKIDMSVNEVISQVLQAGVVEDDAISLVGKWLIDQSSRGRRRFAYRQIVEEAAAADDVAFARSFVHVDWVDGESVVQAEQTTLEDGFNTRFHHIEADLDSLFAQLRKLSDAVAGLRTEAAKAFADISSELNRINGLIDTPSAPNELGFAVPQLVDNSNKFLGTAKLFDKDVTMWQTEKGILTFPNINPAATKGFDGVARTGNLGRFVAENPQVTEAFADPGGLTVAQFVQKFGSITTPSGGQVIDLVAILPADAAFTSPTEMLAELGKREAAAIKAQGLSDAVAVASVGTAAGVVTGTVGATTLSQFEAMPPSIRTALTMSGVDTVGKLAQLQPGELAVKLSDMGFSVNVADAGGWTAMAGSLQHL